MSIDPESLACLRQRAYWKLPWSNAQTTIALVNEIERLRAENERLAAENKRLRSGAVTIDCAGGVLPPLQFDEDTQEGGG